MTSYYAKQPVLASEIYFCKALGKLMLYPMFKTIEIHVFLNLNIHSNLCVLPY